jgi:hypothetical protein
VPVTIRLDAERLGVKVLNAPSPEAWDAELPDDVDDARFDRFKFPGSPGLKVERRVR